MQKVRVYLYGVLVWMSIVSLQTGFAWSGSDPTVKISSPDGVGDVDTVAKPFSVFGECYNSSNGIDFYQLELIHDDDGDAIIDQAEYDARTTIIRKEDYNIEGTNKRLTPRNRVRRRVTDGEKYFIIIWGKDLDGDVSANVDDLVGLGPNGMGNVWEDWMIAYFTVSDVRP